VRFLATSIAKASSTRQLCWKVCSNVEFTRCEYEYDDRDILSVERKRHDTTHAYIRDSIARLVQFPIRLRSTRPIIQGRMQRRIATLRLKEPLARCILVKSQQLATNCFQTSRALFVRKCIRLNPRKVHTHTQISSDATIQPWSMKNFLRTNQRIVQAIATARESDKIATRGIITAYRLRASLSLSLRRMRNCAGIPEFACLAAAELCIRA